MQLEALAKAAKGILNWEQPILTFGLWMAILLIAWRDLLPYSIAMLFFAQVGLLLVFGSWTAFGHEDAVLVGGRQAPSGQRLTILGRLRKFHDTLGSTQHRLHKMNTALLKVRRCCFVGVWGVGWCGVCVHAVLAESVCTCGETPGARAFSCSACLRWECRCVCFHRGYCSLGGFP